MTPACFDAYLSNRAGRHALLLLAIVLTACAPKEDVLPGERFDLREISEAVAAVPTVPTDSSPVAVRPAREVPTPAYSVAGEATRISLPGARNVTSWPQQSQNAGHLAPHAQLRTGALTQVWTTSFGAGNDLRQRISSAPVSDGARVFVLDSEMGVSAISTSGAILWQRNLTPATETRGEVTGGGLAVDGGRLYVTTGFGALHVLDSTTGAELWTQKFDAATTAAPVVDGGLVYVVSRDGIGWAIDRKNGRIVWQIEGTAASATVLGSGAPAIAGRSAIFPFGSGELDAVLKLGGVSLWSSSVSGTRTGRAYSGVNGVAGGPVVSGRTLYVATNAGRLAALDAASGARLWTALEGGTGPVVVAGGSVFVVTDEARLVRLDAGDGARIWAATLPLYETEKIRRRKDVFVHYGPVLAGGRLILASSDGLLREIDPASGKLLRATDLGASAASAPIIVGGTLYVITANGVLHAFR